MEIWEDHKATVENNRKAIIITLIINVMLLIGFYFIMVWKQPDPPMSQFGLELNLGFSDMGSDAKPTETPPSTSQETAEEAPAPGEPAPEPTENITPVSPPQSNPSPAEVQKSEPKIEAVSKAPSPVKAEPKPVEKKESIKETTKKAEVPVKSEPEEEPQPEKVEKPEPKVDPRAIFGAGGTTGSGNQATTGSSQGNSCQTGDEGKPNGTIDGRSILQSGKGNTGDGAGYDLDLAGWDFASKPNIQDRVSNRNGKIVFNITINDSGRIVQAIPDTYNVSNEVLNYYRKVVNSLTFKPQSGNTIAEYSKGKITFIIRVD
ncbi:energy transducer TonB [uncultured Cyclobacterium sp.]|uniref:energy transducer TonB n=1 Tax=uncultured Cyclobacterium sp. TaxID=453820 RepID=UPI0030ECE24D